MSVTKTKIGTIHVTASCSDCDKSWDDYRTAIANARRHADDTGHKVHVERGQVWTYNQRS